MKNLTNKKCKWIENIINERPRKRHGYKTPKELYV
jgi:IS30 family transposase